MVASPKSYTSAVVDRLHQVLKVRENVGVGLVAVLGHYLTVNDDVKLAMRAWGEFEVSDMFASPAQRFPCHPGSAGSVASILAIEDLQFQFFSSSQGAPPIMVETTSIILRQP